MGPVWHREVNTRGGCRRGPGCCTKRSVGNGGVGVRRVLEPHPSSVREARQYVRDVLRAAGREDLVETAELLVSELVTNALVHVGSGLEIAAWVEGDVLRVEVGDASPHAPLPRHHPVTAGTGRGLRLVSSMVDRWGTTPRGVGKVVWFELENGDHEPDLGDWDVADLEDDQSGRVVAPGGSLPRPLDVELLNVPLLLHTVWQQHADALLRELLLIRIGAGSNTDELWAHALASEAMSFLQENLPTPNVGEDADELMVSAVEPFVSSDREVLHVPAEIVDHFRVLDETLEAAVGMAEAGFLLTPPTQPEVQAFRHWICGEIQRQAIGEAPIPWSDVPTSAPAPAARIPLGWTSDEVSGSALAVMAADDTNRLIAASPSALELLGYAGPEELVGRRLVTIIPARFRQAHVAGFTLHLANGRAPLLDRWVTVPVLRKDGSEIDVRLLVAAEMLPAGRRVFVARLEPA
ncbi:PAS domain S-box protein [Nocardioides ginsengisegetis]|uniref:PAS domain S-box protein n=1 Tax=Nocardioides ginsengisegetis TaxID=661491 RepID=UPI001FE4C631|nr:PAS domain S-box protein [Nocardioides ginsengisegetis]